MADYHLIMCNGDMLSPKQAFTLASRARSIICADGGANAARELGILPHLIIGDLDSIYTGTLEYFRYKGVSIVHLIRQTDTDFEKALLTLEEQGAETVVVLGGTGRLLDHTLGNFSIVLRHLPKLRFVLFDPSFRIDVITANASFPCRQGTRVSIVPLAPSYGISYEGLQYQLPSDTLIAGEREGTCNRCLGQEFTVRVESGALLVFRELSEGMYEI